MGKSRLTRKFCELKLSKFTVTSQLPRQEQLFNFLLIQILSWQQQNAHRHLDVVSTISSSSSASSSLL